jgi:hypothetical protein
MRDAFARRVAKAVDEGATRAARFARFAHFAHFD